MAKRYETPDGGELQSEVTRLADEVGILRMAIDEFRTDFIHMLRCLPEHLPPPYAHLYTLAETITPETDSNHFSANVPPVSTKQEPPLPTKTATNRRETLFD